MRVPFKFDPKLAFDIVYNAEGGRSNITDAESPLLALYRRVESAPDSIYSVAKEMVRRLPAHKNLSPLKFPSVTFGLLDSQIPNCYCTKMNDRFFIGMSAVFPLCALELAYFIFGTTEYFSDIGDPTLQPYIRLDGIEMPPFYQLIENRYQPRVLGSMSEFEAKGMFKSACTLRGYTHRYSTKTGDLLSAHDFMSQLYPILELLKPRCSIRNSACEYVARMICTFFWLHEIAHVTRDHLSLVNFGEATPQLRLSALPNDIFSSGTGSLTVEQNLHVAIEIDADRHAFLATLGVMLTGLDLTDEMKEADRYKNIEVFVYFLILTFAALYMRDRRRGTLIYTTHPPAKYRLMNLLAYLRLFSSENTRLKRTMNRTLSRIDQLSEDGTFSYLFSTLHFTAEEGSIWESAQDIMYSESFTRVTSTRVGLEPLEAAVLQHGK